LAQESSASMVGSKGFAPQRVQMSIALPNWWAFPIESPPLPNVGTLWLG
jgi:hypothetical protein